MNSENSPESLFAQDEAPAVDPTFRAGVMRAVAQRRFRIELGIFAASSLVMLIVLFVSGDALMASASQLASSLGEPGIVLLIAGGVAFLGHALITRAIRLPLRAFS